MSTLTKDNVGQHNLQFQRRTMCNGPFECEMYGAPWRAIIRTLAGRQCGPAGLGELTVDGDFRLTCPPHLLVSDVLNMHPWHRFSTDEEKRSQREAREEETWWRPLGSEVKSLVFGRGSAGSVAPCDYPIGSGGADVTALLTPPSAWARGVPVDTTLLQSVRTPPTPSSRSSSADAPVDTTVMRCVRTRTDAGLMWSSTQPVTGSSADWKLRAFSDVEQYMASHRFECRQPSQHGRRSICPSDLTGSVM